MSRADERTRAKISRSQRERYERERRATERLAWLREAIEDECIVLEGEDQALDAGIRQRMARRLRAAVEQACG